MNKQTILHLENGKKLWRGGEIKRAEASFHKAFEEEPNDRNLMIIVVQSLQEMGAKIAAIEVLQLYLSQNTADPVTIEICSELAVQFEFYEIGERLSLISIQMEPAEPRHYVNYCNALRAQDKLDEAIEVALAALENFSEYAPLWSVLGKSYIEKGGPNRQTYDVLRQAVELDKNNTQNLLALANNSLPYADEASRLYLDVIEKAPDSAEAHISYSVYLLAQGELSRAWPHYEYRLDSKLGPKKSQEYVCSAPVWTGQPLLGKNILIGAEQGLGDELFFAINYLELLNQGAQLLIGCDPRLVTIFERSFKGAICGAFEDNIYEGVRYRSFPSLEDYAVDYFIPAGSILQYLWPSLKELPSFSGGYLVPDKALSEKIKQSLPVSDKPIVGLSWRSGNMAEGRCHGYIGLDGAKQIVSSVDAIFICLQYSVEDVEIDALKNAAKEEFLSIPNLDLKQDIEANLALMSSLDYIVGPPIATQMMGLSTGKPTGLISHGLPWWGFGEDDLSGPRIMPSVEWFIRTKRVWDDAIGAVIHRLNDL